MQINQRRLPIFSLFWWLRKLTFSALVLAIAVNQSACTLLEPVTSFFSDSDEEEAAARLVNFDQDLRVRRSCSVNVGIV